MSKKDYSTFDQFFKSDQNIVKDMLQKKGHKLKETFAKKIIKSLPKLPESKVIDKDKAQTKWQAIRSFFRNANNLEGLPKSFTPILISPTLTSNLIIKEYPAYISDDSKACIPLSAVLSKGIKECGEKDLTIYLDRIIQLANEKLGENEKPIVEVINGAFKELSSQISMGDQEKEKFNKSLGNLSSHLPTAGRLLSHSIIAPYRLLNAGIHNATRSESSSIIKKIKEYSSKLKDLLSIEEEKNPNLTKSSDQENISSFTDSVVKFDQIASIMPEPGGVAMAPERVKRIQNIVEIMEDAGDIFKLKAHIYIDHGLSLPFMDNIEDIFKGSEVNRAKLEESMESIYAPFKQKIQEYTRLIVALRTAELELDNKYQQDVHDEYFRHFHWQNFSQEELNAFPLFAVITTDESLFSKDYTEFSKLLSRNIPIKIICVRRKLQITEASETIDSDQLHAPPELSAMMLTHRNIYVSQSTSVTPKHLYQNYYDGFRAFAPAFIYVMDNNDPNNGLDPILTSAAIESRDFPIFTYKGMLGTPWGSRFNVESNPNPNQLWTSQKVKVQDYDGTDKEMEFAFTYADYEANSPKYQRFFLPVDASVWRDDLIPLTEYVTLSEDMTIGKVPYIWMVDKKDILHKVAVSWPMVMATQERFDFWKFLQENSGINNYHVAHAVESMKKSLNEKYAVEIAALKEQHLKEIEKARDDEAESVMDNLTAALLDLNLSESSFTFPSTPTRRHDDHSDGKISSNELSTKSEGSTEIEEDSFVISNEPYIDTPLCTSCNECINMNGQLFKYDSDKMAFIADPRAGTFKELVEAAEKCPVGIIHPGSPLNQDEPNLDQLIARAEKFN